MQKALSEPDSVAGHHFEQKRYPRCNAIMPSFYAAEQNHDTLFNKDGSYTDRAGDIITGTPMGRRLVSEELIGAALFWQVMMQPAL